MINIFLDDAQLIKSLCFNKQTAEMSAMQFCMTSRNNFQVLWHTGKGSKDMCITGLKQISLTEFQIGVIFQALTLACYGKDHGGKVLKISWFLLDPPPPSSPELRLQIL